MRTIRGILCAAILLGALQPAWAGPFVRQRTLRMRFAEADLIVFGRTGTARKGAGGGGDTELIIHEVIKAHAFIKERKVLKLDRFLESDPSKPRYFVVEAEVNKGRLGSMSGIETNERGVAYIRGFLKLDPKKQPEMLRYYFDFLGDEAAWIADDAYLELYHAPVAARFEAARTLPAAKVWKLVRDTEEDSSRRNLFASLLASCGKPSDADELFKLSESSKQRTGFYFSILSLNAKEYAARLRALAKEKKETNDNFLIRYSVFRAASKLYEANSTAFPREKCIEMVADFLEQGDMADFAVERFCKWKRWEFTDAILKLSERKSHKAVIVRNAILRYALQAPGEQAAAFVAKMRKDDAELVRYLEESIEEEKQETPK